MVGKDGDGQTDAAVTQSDEPRPPEGDVTVAVETSTVTDKDGPGTGPGRGPVRASPHRPGIGFAGADETCDDECCERGGKMVLTGWRVGENRWGGHAEKARVKAGILVPLPDGLTTRQAMGLAGLLHHLQKVKDSRGLDDLRNSDGDVLCVFPCPDGPFPCLDEYPTHVGASELPRTGNEDVLVNNPQADGVGVTRAAGSGRKKRQDLRAMFHLPVAAVRQQEAHQIVDDRKVGRIVDFALVAGGAQQSCASQHRQVPRERRGQDVEPTSDLPNLQAVRAGLHQKPEDRHARGLGERPKGFDCSVLVHGMGSARIDES